MRRRRVRWNPAPPGPGPDTGNRIGLGSPAGIRRSAPAADRPSPPSGGPPDDARLGQPIDVAEVDAAFRQSPASRADSSVRAPSAANRRRSAALARSRASCHANTPRTMCASEGASAVQASPPIQFSGRCPRCRRGPPRGPAGRRELLREGGQGGVRHPQRAQPAVGQPQIDAGVRLGRPGRRGSDRRPLALSPSTASPETASRRRAGPRAAPEGGRGARCSRAGSAPGRRPGRVRARPPPSRRR